MKNVSVKIPDEQRGFLETIKFEDAAKNNSEAISWCIDSCMKIEKRYGADACYVAHNNIALDMLLDCGKEGLSDYNIKFYDRKELLQIKASNFSTAGLLASAYIILKEGVGYGIEWIESDRTHHKVPFEL